MRILIVNDKGQVCEDLTVDPFWMANNFVPGQNITKTIANAIERSVWLEKKESKDVQP